MSSRYIAVCGPRASGKSTLARHLARHLGVECYEERPSAASDFLRRLRRWDSRQVYKSQLAFLTHAAIRQRAAAEGGVVERVIDDNFHVFCTTAYRYGYLGRSDYESLRRMCDFLNERTLQPSLIVYLQVSGSLLRSSSRHRGWLDDDVVSDEYATALRNAYNDWRSTSTIAPFLDVKAFVEPVELMALRIAAAVRSDG